MELFVRFTQPKITYIKEMSEITKDVKKKKDQTATFGSTRNSVEYLIMNLFSDVLRRPLIKKIIG